MYIYLVHLQNYLVSIVTLQTKNSGVISLVLLTAHPWLPLEQPLYINIPL